VDANGICDSGGLGGVTVPVELPPHPAINRVAQVANTNDLREVLSLEHFFK
jgi:hypothetical protein